MMKKLSIIAFAGFYFLASVGIAVNIHYCMGQIGNINLYAEAGSCCCGDEEMEDECCDDSSFFYQIDQDQKVNKPVRTSGSDLFAFCYFLTYQSALVGSETSQVDHLQTDPFLYKQPAWLLNCSLTYYG